MWCFYIIRIYFMKWSVFIIGRNTNVKSNKKYDVPIWQKQNLTLDETAAYSGIGINKLREITNSEDCKFVLWIGNKRLVKRRLFDDYVERQFSI